MIETDKFPYVPARWQKRYTKADRRPIRGICLHDMEAPETASTAENVARYLQTTPRQASAHYCCDSDSIIQCVLDNNIAFGAPGINQDFIHIEQAGYAVQDGAAWLDPYGVLMINRVAKLSAQLCLKYDIPRVKLTPQELKAGVRGICGHADATAVYVPNSGHSDPGNGYPWDWFIQRLNEQYELIRARA